MLRFPLHTTDTVSPASAGLLRRIAQSLGFLPNLFAKIAESEVALAAYLDLRAHFERSSLGPLEQQVVCLAASVENDSVFCVSAHSASARLAGMDEETLAALRDNRELPDPRLAVLADFTRTVVRQRGAVDDGDLNILFAAGFTRSQALDVILGVALKTFSNYASQLVQAPLNAEIFPERWNGPAPAPVALHPAIRQLAARDPDLTTPNQRRNH